MPVKIVTDSAADLTAQQVADHDIRVVPLKIRFGDEEFTDGVDLTTEAFYEKMARSDVMPATAAPAPGQFEQAMREAGRDGDPVICINISSGLSATMQSAENAARAIGSDLDIYEGRYGLEDTRHAIQEARDAGLTPFCVTIDHEAHDYLPMLFGSNGYALVRQPQDLTRRLTQAWVTLAR